MNRTEIERRLRQTTWLQPTAELRARVLSSAPVVAPPPVTWSDRIWFSRRFRVTAAATVAGLVAIELLLPADGGVSVVPASQSAAEAQAIDDVGRSMGLPAGIVATLARRTPAPALHPWPNDQLRLGEIEALEMESDRR